MQQEPSTTPTKPKGKDSNIPKKKKRRRGGFLNLLLFIGIIGAVALFFWAEQQRRDALGRLKETEQQLNEIKKSTEQSGELIADETLKKVRNHIEIPEEQQPTVATIVDVERLRETSEFYNKAENGDNLVLTENRAILYDPDRDIIIDVVPVVLDQQQDQQQNQEGEQQQQQEEAIGEENQPNEPDQEPAQETNAPEETTPESQEAAPAP